MTYTTLVNIGKSIRIIVILALLSMTVVGGWLLVEQGMATITRETKFYHGEQHELETEQRNSYHSE